MRYYLTQDTLIVRGAFRACSTGENGGIKNVTSLLIHQVQPSNPSNYLRLIRNTAYRRGLSPEAAFGLLIPEQSTHHAVFRYDQVTLFITAGVASEDPGSREIQSAGTSPNMDITTRIICTINGHLEDRDLLNALITVGKVEMETSSGDKKCTGWDRRGIIIGSEYSGASPSNNPENIGEKIFRATSYGAGYIRELFLKIPGRSSITSSFHIHTTIGGDRWIEWDKKGCPYYPCHFRGQRCDFCYCPLYPCEDETLGEWTTGSRSSGRVWSCAPCTLNHQPVVVHHLRRNPEASSSELISLLANYPLK
ncbi:MAG TPA: cysteine-rich small domain-containing protein [Methanospirillum sp.]|uniref:cysteine-rich small domain-containing protein n=1 Tax=Methanospirillum sp. TaxID=45200 RepID=UPI002B704EAE|nr:cysteine-rich small domain-containing protein [Methanospirillum sp.]HWQ64388.1 cysteine-rich small domain-containing protein [Methanospirillum sp.]